MVFNGDSDKQDICTLADDYVNTDVNLFPLQQKARYANVTMSYIWTAIFEAYGGWQFDDSNQGNLPVAVTDLVSGQQQYSMPIDAVSVRGIEVKTIGGSWQKITPITEEEIRRFSAEAEFYKVAAQTQRYRAMDGIIKLYPSTNYSQAASLRMTFDRAMTQFASTDTTKQPGFMSNFHHGVALGMALEFAKAKRLPSLGGISKRGIMSGLMADWSNFISEVKDYYSQRWAERFPTRITVKDAVREYS